MSARGERLGSSHQSNEPSQVSTHSTCASARREPARRAMWIADCPFHVPTSTINDGSTSSIRRAKIGASPFHPWGS